MGVDMLDPGLVQEGLFRSHLGGFNVYIYIDCNYALI